MGNAAGCAPRPAPDGGFGTAPDVNAPENGPAGALVSAAGRWGHQARSSSAGCGTVADMAAISSLSLSFSRLSS